MAISLTDTDHGFVALGSGFGNALSFQFPARAGNVSAVSLLTLSASTLASTGDMVAWGFTGDLLGGIPISDPDVLTDSMLIVGGRIGGLGGDLVIPFTPPLLFPGRALFRVFNAGGATNSIHVTAYSTQLEVSTQLWTQLMRRRSWEGD